MSFAWFFIGAILATWWSRSGRRGWRCGGSSAELTVEQIRRKQKMEQIRETAVDLTLEAMQTARIRLAAIRSDNIDAQAVLERERVAATAGVIPTSENRNMGEKNGGSALV